MKVVSSRIPLNHFERALLARIGAFQRLDGIVTNNVILPNPVRNLPNEHDLIVLLAGRLVTIDAKELWSGVYRDSAGGWEYLSGGQWTRVEGFVHPIDVAFKKCKVAEKFVRSRIGPGAAMPEILSCIVVPDGCNISALGGGVEGRTPLGARFLMARAEDLEGVLLKDIAAFPQRRPTPEDLGVALGIDRISATDPIACQLSEDLVVTEMLEHRWRPVPHTVYIGQQHKPRERRVRIEVCPYSADDRSAEALMRAHRSHLVALQESAFPGVIRLYDHRQTPTATVFVHEFFSRTSLADLVQEQILEWTTTRVLLSRLVKVLDELHAASVIHRYLDPAAILVACTSPLDIRLCDFFGARAIDVSTLGQDPAASPFDAPERHPDAPSSPAMDWFSVGRCVRFMLTGDAYGMPVPGGGIPNDLGQCLLGLEAEPGMRAEAWRRLRDIVDRA